MRGKFMEFRYILKSLRKEKKLTQSDLAKLLNLSTSTISMYEIGNRTPDLETLEIFADFFNVDTDYILGRSSVKLKYDISLLMRAETLYELGEINQEDSLIEKLKTSDLQIFDKIPQSDLGEYEKLLEVNMVLLKDKRISPEDKEILTLIFKKIFIKHHLTNLKEHT